MKKRLLILGMIFYNGCVISRLEVRHQTMQVRQTKTKQTADVQDSQKDTSSSDNKNDTSYKSADEITNG